MTVDPRIEARRAALAQLREPFAESETDKLPRIWCKPCRDAREKHCSQHSKSKCRDCGQYITEAHLHLDYVGHAGVTARLLDVDPEWNWEPLAHDELGRPIIDLDEKGRPVGLWIKLTIAGVCRLGYGTVEPGKAEPMKELIGDALRNAGMRFGIALDLWKKHSDSDRAETKTRGAKPTQPSATPTTGSQTPAALVARLFAVMKKRECAESFVKKLAKDKWPDIGERVSLSKLGAARCEELADFIERATEEKLGDLAVKLMGDGMLPSAKKPDEAPGPVAREAVQT